MNFLYAIKLSSDFYKVQISTNYEKFILKFVVLSTAHARLCNILSVVRGITCMNNVHIILESMSEKGKRSIVIRYISDWINWNYSDSCPCSHLYSVVACIEWSPFYCPVIEYFIWIEPLLRGHLSYKATFSLSQMWPLNTGLTVMVYF